ncbi:phosphatase PAP2 family protein [Enterococcus italicus]|uniref:PAP2 family protein n=1 Tax=Enterococcus italicus (strain DSM 15952 / CCUG 50447 / LMG 22039 / TP 1.5) TaxID=888064 RepID=E6LIK1_ENTI1|nr:phosphatase PAP2 family protein [Enterococcus italicus]EFU72982.1 PAP2 family protein [Enterococcus italicus DSM 15952]OJG60490.1 phospholipid phosphatase [Enterococcus italicus DSM 15952]
MQTPQQTTKLYSQFTASCFLLLFMFLGYVVKFYPQWLNSFDQLGTAIIRFDYPNWNPFFLWVTKFGNPTTVSILFVAILGLFLYWKKYAEALWLSLGVIGIAAIFNLLIKLFFTRERPSLVHLVTENSYSFPSGHANGSMVFYGTLFLLIPFFIQTNWVKWLLRIICVFLIIGIGTSRIYLGVHYPSDILAGYSEGLVWLGFTYPLFKEKQFIWRFTQKQK